MDIMDAVSYVWLMGCIYLLMDEFFHWKDRQ